MHAVADTTSDTQAVTLTNMELVPKLPHDS